MLHFVQHDMMMDILFLLWTSNYLVEQGTFKPLVESSSLSSPSLIRFLLLLIGLFYNQPF